MNHHLDLIIFFFTVMSEFSMFVMRFVAQYAEQVGLGSEKTLPPLEASRPRHFVLHLYLFLRKGLDSWEKFHTNADKTSLIEIVSQS